MQEGFFSKLVGRALLALSGAGKDYKKVRKMMNDPEFRRDWDNMEADLKAMTDKFKKIDTKYLKK